MEDQRRLISTARSNMRRNKREERNLNDSQELLTYNGAMITIGDLKRSIERGLSDVVFQKTVMLKESHASLI
mgnify:CR=1 FL=1